MIPRGSDVDAQWGTVSDRHGSARPWMAYATQLGHQKVRLPPSPPGWFQPALTVRVCVAHSFDACRAVRGGKERYQGLRTRLAASVLFRGVATQ